MGPKEKCAEEQVGRKQVAIEAEWGGPVPCLLVEGQAVGVARSKPGGAPRVADKRVGIRRFRVIDERGSCRNFVWSIASPQPDAEICDKEKLEGANNGNRSDLRHGVGPREQPA